MSDSNTELQHLLCFIIIIIIIMIKRPSESEILGLLLFIVYMFHLGLRITRDESIRWWFTVVSSDSLPPLSSSILNSSIIVIHSLHYCNITSSAYIIRWLAGDVIDQVYKETHYIFNSICVTGYFSVGFVSWMQHLFSPELSRQINPLMNWLFYIQHGNKTFTALNVLFLDGYLC